MAAFMKRYLVVVLGLLVSPAAWSESTSECSQIENARERLACFDHQFPNAERILPKQQEPAEAKVFAPPPPAAELSSGAEQTASVETRSTQPPASDTGSGGLFGWLDELNIDTEIAAVRSGGQQRMVFRLTNGQIWMQSSPRDLPFAAGDKVNIKNARMGGYIMRSDSGTSTRVRRIE